MSTLRNTILWTWALVWVNYLSNNAIINAAYWTKDAVANAMNSWWNALWKVSPFIWSMAPLALGWYSIYQGIKESEKTNVWNWVEKGLLTYGIPWFILSKLSLLSIPLAPQILMAWLWMYGIKKIVSAIADSYSTIKKSNPLDAVVDFGISLPWKAWDWLGKIEWSKMFSKKA